MAFTSDQIRKARQTDMLSYFERQNELARKAGKIEPYVIEQEGGQYRLKDHSGLLFQQNFWNQRGTNQGGNMLDFLTNIERMSFKDAVEHLLHDELNLQRVDPEKRYQKPKIEFKLPEDFGTFRRTIAYLTKTRGLDAEIVLGEIRKGNLYEDKQYHNAVFVGRDEQGDPVWAQKRATLSEVKIVLEQPGSDARYPYFYGNRDSKTVVVVESPIEALSYATMIKMNGNDPTKVAILALGGVHDTGLDQYLKNNRHVENIVTATNNDYGEKPDEIKGREGAERIRQKYEKRGYYVKSVFPKGNDWNDDLRALRAEERAKKPDPIKEKDVEAQIRDYARMKAKQKQQERVPAQRGPTRTITRGR